MESFGGTMYCLEIVHLLEVLMTKLVLQEPMLSSIFDICFSFLSLFKKNSVYPVCNFLLLLLCLLFSFLLVFLPILFVLLYHTLLFYLTCLSCATIRNFYAQNRTNLKCALRRCSDACSINTTAPIYCASIICLKISFD